ncbi:MAG: DNA polymerase II large subunit [Candidatus Pacearchaeota archaeon]
MSFNFTEKYFSNLLENVMKEYKIASLARSKGLDLSKEVEVPLASSLAEKSVGLISTIYPQMKDSSIPKRILELEEEYGKLDPAVSLKIAEEIAKEKFCKFRSLLEAIDAGIRVGFAYITLGVVSSPLEGFTHLKTNKTSSGEEYFVPYFSGPIRSAGGTGAAFSLIIIDYLREIFGYAKYDPTEEEIKRTLTEIVDYHERVTNLQYFPTEEEILFLARNIPIQINGDPTEDKQVSNFKDLKRIETNYIRGGFCLVFAEGLAQKAAKILRMVTNLRKKGFALSDWNFLEKYVEIHKKREKGDKDVTPTYIKDIVAGRPIFGHPSRSGAFRFRYGRSRVSGFSATSIHPATMFLSNSFISSGTQLKLERPSKGCVVTPCDLIEGPIVKFKNGSVKKIKSLEESKNIYNEVSEIIYLGDILFSLGDVVNRNSELLKPGFVEEWWAFELEEKIKETNSQIDEKLKNFISKPLEFKPSLSEAIEISKKYQIPLHPSFIFFWSQITSEQFSNLLLWISKGSFNENLVLPFSSSFRQEFSLGKRALELLGVEHDVFLENVIIKETEAFFVNLGLSKENFKEKSKTLREKFLETNKEVLDFINENSEFIIKDKAGDFIGARMGRPEKAKLRKLVGSPNCLFSIGEEGGRFRSINEAYTKGYVNAEFSLYFCDSCKKESIYPYCIYCGKETRRFFFCNECGDYLDKKCNHSSCFPFNKRKVYIKDYFEKAVSLLNLSKEEIPPLVKGVRGTSNMFHDVENIAKGILRAKYNLTVNKDGTIRYDATEIPLTHFRPSEIGTPIYKLRELGYLKDSFGNDLVDENQIVTLMPHDVLLPSCPSSKDEKADEVFFRVSKFIDELLEKFYNLPPFFNLKTKEDLVGHLVVCMAPHNCAGVVGRIIGFTKMQGLLASPFMHAAMRRDCDGDEAAIMLLLDVLLNFSIKYLPSHRGGTQDAPLVLNTRIREGEVDDQILDLETCWKYSLDLYRLAEQRKHSSEIKFDNVKNFLKEKRNSFEEIGFTHNTSSIHIGIFNSSYKTLPSMKDKVEKQMELVNKIRAVDSSDVARLILERHFIRDIRGNLRKFSQQEFRCVMCNEKYRRPPLKGSCYKCNGRIIFTVSEGAIKKYLEYALKLAYNYEIPSYTKESLELTKMYIESIFGKETEKQTDLKSLFS